VFSNRLISDVYGEIFLRVEVHLSCVQACRSLVAQLKSLDQVESESEEVALISQVKIIRKTSVH